MRITCPDCGRWLMTQQDSTQTDEADRMREIHAATCKGAKR